MNRSLPDITESATELKHRLRSESVGYKKQRLTALYLYCKAVKPQTRQQVAALIGVNRKTIGHWLDAYQAGGIDQMLDRRYPPGRRPLCFRRHSFRGCVQNWIPPVALVAMVMSNNLSSTLTMFK